MYPTAWDYWSPSGKLYLSCLLYYILLTATYYLIQLGPVLSPFDHGLGGTGGHSSKVIDITRDQDGEAAKEDGGEAEEAKDSEATEDEAEDKA